MPFPWLPCPKAVRELLGSDCDSEFFSPDTEFKTMEKSPSCSPKKLVCWCQQDFSGSSSAAKRMVDMAFSQDEAGKV